MITVRDLAALSPPAALRYTREVILARSRTETARRQYDVFSDVPLRRDRYAYTAHRLLASPGHRLGILARPSLLEYAQMDAHARETFRIADAGPVDRPPLDVSGKIYVHGNGAGALASRQWRKIVCLEYGFPARPPRNPSVIMPYAMHPMTYQNGSPSNAALLRDHPRLLRLFFAGNVDPTLYGATSRSMRWFARQLGLRDRRTVITALRTGLADHVLDIASIEDFHDVVRTGTRHHVVLVATAGIRIEQTAWLATLASSDFFLAPPGMYMPLCHNIIEAMSVGTIPLTNYPDWFPEPLRDGHDCIAFRTERELVEKTRAILAMHPAEIARMRAKVSAYYDRHLDPRRFVERIVTHPARQLTIFVITEDEDMLCRITSDSIPFGRADSPARPVAVPAA